VACHVASDSDVLASANSSPTTATPAGAVTFVSEREVLLDQVRIFCD
jgi:hypothetical protein